MINKNFIISIVCLTLSIHTMVFAKTTITGEKRMATLIKTESWAGSNITEVRNNMRAGGWRGDTNGFVNSYHLEHDNVLGNVLYRQWGVSGSSACPDGGCDTIAYNITTAQLRSGVTFHGYVKFDGIIDGRMGSIWHAGIRGNAAAYTGNGGSQFLMETGIPGGRGPDDGFFVMTTGGGERVVTGGSSQNYLQDDTWYEFAWYIRQSPQLMRIHYRPLGTSNWTQVLNGTNGNVSTPSAPWLGFGAYIHGYSSSWGVKRVYYGPCNFYDGDAYTDGNLPDNGGGPVDPVDPPEESPVISDKNVKVSTTDAVLSWKTDKPTNSVVDYGDTETRGTIVRDDELKTDHSLAMSGLQPDTTYYYRFSSKDESGNTTMDETNSTFQTLVEEPVEPPVEVKLEVNDLIDSNVPNAKSGDAFVFNGSEWVAVDLNKFVEDKVLEILDRTKLTVS